MAYPVTVWRKTGTWNAMTTGALEKFDVASDAELLERIARHDVDARAARAAQAELYERHVRYLYGVLLRQRRKLLALAGISAEDLVQDTFHRAFERAHTFKADDLADAEQARRRTRAWLGRIAHHLLCDALDGHREISASNWLDRVSCDAIDESATESPALARVHAALAELPEREQDVLRVTALYHRAGSDAQRLPNAVSQELAQRWNTNSDNIRAIRSRAMKKLKSLLEAP